ncbi:MAG: two-component regulator propeller domain-containing protein [Ignavibacteria bacterium]|nr:two-component regulator propeller domain-containing protein [Ignavibacteria bacterium]
MKIKIVYALIIILNLACPLNGQFRFDFSVKDIRSEYSLQVWTKYDGLPSNTLYGLVKGDDGFFWIGSSNGLARFDGSEFKVFNAANTPEIKANIAADLFKDHRGRIWFTNGGAGLLVMEHDNFKRISEEQGLSLNHPSFFAEAKNGRMYVGTFGGGLNIIEENKSFTKLFLKTINKKNGLSSDDIHSLLIDKQERIWIGTYDEGINLIEGNEIKKFKRLGDQLNTAIEHIFQTSKGEILAATHRGVVIFNGKSFEEKNAFLPLKGKTINHIIEDHEGNLWFSTSNYGIYIYNGKTFFHLSTENLLNSNDISQVLPTKFGVWICSLTEGLSLLKQNKIKVLSVKQGLPHKKARTVFQAPDDVLWIGTSDGIAKYDEQKNKLTPIKSNFADLTVHSWAANANGEIFFGTLPHGILKIVDDKIIPAADRKLLKVNFIRSLKFTDDGTLWIGTNGAGVVLLKNGKTKFIDKSKGLPSDFIACICKDHQNNFWVGTSGGGIAVLNSSGLVLKTISDKNGLANNIVNSITEDEDGVIWIGTSVSGISRIKNNVIFNFNERNGLYSNTIKKLLYDGKGHFWITSDRGIFSIDRKNFNTVAEGKKEKLVFDLFGRNEGMIDEEFNAVADNAGCISRSGKIYAPSNDGVVIIDPELFLTNVETPSVYIDDVFINYKESSKAALENLPPNTESVQINYGGISYLNGKNLKFKYILAGIDKHWAFAGTRRQAFFTHLPQGSYTLKVVAITPDGTESKKAAVIGFTIRPYFWQTLWFQILAAVAVVGFITFYLLFYFKRKYKREVKILEAETALERERMRISKDMHDELGASLTKISLMSDLAKRKANEPDQLKKELDTISEASRNVASSMDEIVWAVNPKNDTLEKTIFYIAQYIDEYLSSTEIEFVIDIPDPLPVHFIHAELRHNLFLVIKEAVNNIVKHSGADTVQLKILIANSVFTVQLEDNGKGIDVPCVDQFSNGLKNMKKRIEDFSGNFEISNNKLNGTKINIELPLK